MKKFLFLLSTLLMLQPSANSQITMDMELKGAYTINGPKYLFSDGAVFFDLNNGFTYGVNFDLRFAPTVALSFGHLYSQSSTTLRQTFRRSGFDHASGSLKDRIFDLGIKKYFPAKKYGLSLAAFVGVFGNFYFFENNDIQVNSSATTADYYNIVQSNSSVRFNKLANLAIGPKLGFYIEKNFERIGRLIVGVSYGFELTNGVDRVISADMFESEKDLATGEVTVFLDDNRTITNTLTRNPFMIEIGFRMPGAMILKEKKKPVLGE